MPTQFLRLGSWFGCLTVVPTLRAATPSRSVLGRVCEPRR